MRILKAGGNDITILKDQIEVGDIAPDVTLCKNDFSEFKLSEYFGKKIIISVFKSIDTGVCANQTRHFNEIASKLDNIVIITVSKDLPPALARFCGAEGIDNLITSSDYKYNDFGDKYGFLIDEERLLTRGLIYIDETGVVKYVEYVADTANEPDYDKLLKYLSNNEN